jgi:hypothetical protein
MKVASLEVELLANLARLQQDMNDAKRIVGNASAEIARYAELAKNAFIGLAGAISAVSIAGALKQSLDYAEGLNKMAQKTGISVERLSELSYAAKMADVSQESLAKGLKGLNEYMVAASNPTSQQARLLKELGVNIKGDTLSAIGQLAKVYEQLPDGATKAALSTEIFKKAGQDMIPFLNQGEAGIAKLRDEARALGLTLSTETARQAEQFNDNIKAITASTGRFGIAVVNEFGPALVKASEAMKEALIDSGKLKAAWVGLGAIGAFLFTDEMLSQAQKQKKEMNELYETINKLAAVRAEEGGFLDRLLNADAMLDKKLAATRARLQALQAEVKASEEQAAREAKAAAERAAREQKEKEEKEKSLRDLLANQRAAADEVLKHNERLRQLDIKGWVEYVEQFYKASEEADLAMAKLDEERNKRESAFNKDQLAAIDKYREEQAKVLADLGQQVAAKQVEIDTFGMSKQAALDYSAALLEARAAQLSLDEATEAQIEAMRTQAQLMRDLAGKEGQLDLMQRQAKANEDSFKTVFDVLQGGFRAALQGAKSFGDYIKTGLKNALYELVARPFIVQIAASLTGASGQVVASALGGGGGAGGIGSMLGTAGSLVGSIGSMFGATSGYATSASTMAGLQSAGVFGGSSTATSMMGSLSAAGPYIAAALAAYALYQTFRDKGENPKYRLGFGSSAQGYASDSIFGAQGFLYAQGNDSQNQGFRDAQRGTAGLDALIARGMTPAQIAAATGRLNGVQGREFSFPKGDPTASEQLLLEYTKLKYSAVFQDLDKEFADYISNFTGKSEDLIKAIGEMAGVLDALSNTSIKGLTLDALRAFQAEGESLAQTFSRVTGAFDAYSKLFVPESERNQKLFEALADALKAQNAVLPSTREGYRALVDAQDLSTASGRELWQVLVNSAGVADTYYRALEAGTEVIEEQIKLINKEQELRIQLMELEGDSAGALAARREIELSTLDANSRALQLRIYHLQDEQAALERAAAASQRMANAVAGFNQAAGGRFPEYGRALAQARLDAALDKFATTAYATWTAGSATNTAVITSQVLANLRNGSLNPARALAYAQTQGPGAVEALTEVLNAYAAYEQATQQTTTAVSDLGRAASGAVDQMAGAIESLTKYLGGSLLSSLSPLTPSERLAEAERQYVENLMRAQRGDATAVAEFGAFRDAYLQEARSMYASSPEFTRIFGATYNQGAGLTAGAVGPLTGADMMRSTQSIVAALMDVQSQVATVTAAVDNLTAVTRQGDQANVNATNRVASVSAAAVAGTEAAVRA